jgi:hypothetical protein
MATKKPNSPDEIKDIAMSALLDVAADKQAPAAARAAAARTMLEVHGAIGRNQDLAKLDEHRSLAEMSPGEINEEIARLSRKLPRPRIKKLDLG